MRALDTHLRTEKHPGSAPGHAMIDCPWLRHPRTLHMVSQSTEHRPTPRSRAHHATRLAPALSELGGIFQSIRQPSTLVSSSPGQIAPSIEILSLAVQDI